MRRSTIGAVLTLIAALSLAGCGDESSSAALQKDDVSGVSKTYDRTDPPRRSYCPEVQNAEERIIDAARSSDDKAWEGDFVEYRLDSGEFVDGEVVPSGARSADLPASLLADLGTAIDTCAGQVSDGNTVTPLTGLAEGQVGYRNVQQASDAKGDFEQISERVWAVRGSLVVGVGVQNRGEPSITAVDLLPKALKRAKDAPKE